MLTGRLSAEIELLRQRWPKLIVVEEGQWVRIPDLLLPPGWGLTQIDVVFQFPQAGYPQNPFYGFYVPTGLRLNGAMPQNFTDPAGAQPPFPDTTWAFFSGNPDPWDPRSDIHAGSNAVTWVQSIRERFKALL